LLTTLPGSSCKGTDSGSSIEAPLPSCEDNDRLRDLGSAGLFGHHVMADDQFGMARLDLSTVLATGTLADRPDNRSRASAAANRSRSTETDYWSS
jgi:hypothetical protein